MASYPPPSSNAGIFDSSLFDTSTGDGLTFAEAELNFLKFPTAQGTENLLDTNITGDLDITGSISYNDNSVQTSAYTGAKSLAGSYSLASLTLDTDGKITALSSGTTTALVSLSGTQTITGQKTFSQQVLCSATPTTSTALTTKTYVDTAITNLNIGNYVSLSGTQTISGAKTFSLPVVCNGAITTGTQLTTKTYVDTAIDNIDYSDFVNLTGGQTITGSKNFTDIDIGDAFATSILYDDNSVQFSAYTGWATAGTYTNPTISFGVDGDITNIESGDLSKIDAIQETSTATTLDVKDTIQVIELATTTKSIITPTQLSYYNGATTVSADTSDIIAVGNLNGTIPSLSANQTFTGEIDFDAQTTFNNLAPHCSVVPTFGNDLTNKDYVDGLISSSIVGGGLVTYLEASLSAGILDYRVLATAFDTTGTVSIVTNALGTNTVSAFITNANIPYIYNAGVVPAGLWNLAIYATTSSSQGQLNLEFTINKYNTSTSTKTLIATSGQSSDINSTSVTPDLYHCSATFPQTTFATNERILIEIISIGIGMNAGTTLTTYYEGNYYSYLTTSISSGAGVFSTNNVWTGNNTFNGTTNTFSNALTCSNSVATPTINNTTNSATLSIGESQTGIINIGSASNSANQNLNGTWRATTKLQTPIIEGTSSAIDIKANTNGHITQATTRTDIYDTNVYVGQLDNAGTITSTITNIGTNSFTKTGTTTVNIGYNNPVGSSLNIRSKNVDFGGTSVLLPTTVNFNQYCDVEFAQAPLYTGTPIGLNDNTGLLATTAFVKGQEYATLDSPVFTGTPTAPTPLTADDSTQIATTEWVKNQGYTSAGDFLEKTSATAITLTAPSYDFQITGGNSISVNNNAIAPYSDIYYPPTATIDLTPSATMPNNRIVYLTGGTYTLTDPVVTVTATFIFQSSSINLVLGGISPGFLDTQTGDIGDTITSVCSNQTVTITRYTAQVANKWYIIARNPSWLVDAVSDVSVGTSAGFTNIGKTTATVNINGANITLGDTTNTIVNSLKSSGDIVLEAPILEVPNEIRQTTSGTMNLFTNLGTNLLYINNTGGTGLTHIGNSTGGVRLYGTTRTSIDLVNVVPSNGNNIYNTTTGAWSGGAVASSVNLGNGACGNIIIGSSTQTGSTSVSAGTTATFGATTQSGNTTIQANSTSGNIVVNNPLQIGYDPAKITSTAQIGYTYASTTFRGANGTNGTLTSFSPISGDATPPVLLPAGVYMLNLTGCVIGFGVNISGVRWLGGVAYGTNISFTNANTTKITTIGTNANSDGTFTTGAGINKIIPVSTSYVFSVPVASANTNYYTGYLQIVLTGTASVGNISACITGCSITRIA